MNFLTDEATGARATLLLAHGAGAPMDTPFMNAFAHGLAAQDVSVVRFEFAYMAARRTGGSKRPPPRAERLMDEYRTAISGIGVNGPIIIGGKSLGGRVASLIAQEEWEAGRVAGLVCLGYPFHPPGKPDKLRTSHLLELTVPSLIVQGERDRFGTIEDVAGYGLPSNIKIYWAGDGDHDLKPRKKSGLTVEQNWQDAVNAIASWVLQIVS